MMKQMMGFPLRLWMRWRVLRNAELGCLFLRRAVNLEQLSGLRVTSKELIIQAKDGREFVWDLRSPNSLLTLPTTGNFEEKETKFVRKWTRTGATTVDCGANFGWYTTLLSRLVGKNGSVHSFEPVPSAAQLLDRNIDLNHCRENVRVNRLALGERCGEADIWVPCREGAGTPFASFYKQNWGSHKKIYCKVITLDEYARQQSLETIDFVKCDVEGAELLVLRGAQELLKNGMCPIWLLEVAPSLMQRFGYGPKELQEFLRSFEYRLYVLNEEGEPTEVKDVTRVGEHNFVAIPR